MRHKEEQTELRETVQIDICYDLVGFLPLSLFQQEKLILYNKSWHSNLKDFVI